MDDPLGEVVSCYAGAAYPERPQSFIWQGNRLKVRAVLATWSTPEGKTFRVQTSAGERFDLKYNQSADSWQIVPLELRTS